MAYNTVYVWSAYETLGSTNLNSNMANLGYLKNKADQAIWTCKVFFPTQDLSSGDGKYGFSIPDWLDGYDLADWDAKVWIVSSSGDITIQLRNETQGVDVFNASYPIVIDEGESDTSTAATPAQISNAGVDAFDEMYIDMDGIGTGAKGLQVDLRYYLT